MILEPRPLIEITQEALSLLYRELGLVNTVRFLSQFTTGFGNFTEERRALIENEAFDDVVVEIRDYQKARSANA